MPVFLIIVGILGIIVAVRGTEHELANQLGKDFSGDPSYAYWVVAVIVIGSIGYVPGLENVSTMFLVLILLAFVLQNGGVFDQASAAVKAL